jgi:hypothetical protein
MLDPVSTWIAQRRFRLVLIASSLIGFAWGSAETSGGEEKKPEGIVVEAKFLDDGSMVTVPVRLGKRTYLFAIDTAATGTVFDTALVSELGKGGDKIQANGVHGQIPLELFEGPSEMWLGTGQVTFPKKVGVTSMSELQQFNRAPIMGVLGLDCLNRFAIHIDFSRQSVFLCNPAKNAPDRTTVPLVRRNGMPAVAMTVDDQKFDIVLDTGCLKNGILSHEIAASLLEGKHARVCPPPRTSTKGEPSRAESAIRCRQVDVAGVSNHDLIFTTGKHNILGLWYLSRYRCTIDLAQNTLRLEPTSDSDLPDHFDFDGLWLRSSDERIIVVNDVISGSLAEAAGFKKGDVLVSLDHRPVGNRRKSWLYMDFFYKRRTKASIAVMRDGKEIVLELAAKPVTKVDEVDQVPTTDASP